MIINIGAAVQFAFYHPQCPEKLCRTRLESGDALLFNGEVLFHGVEKVETGTDVEGSSSSSPVDVAGRGKSVPEWWGDVAGELGLEADVIRIGLQMRVMADQPAHWNLFGY